MNDERHLSARSAIELDEYGNPIADQVDRCNAISLDDRGGTCITSGFWRRARIEADPEVESLPEEAPPGWADP